MYRKMMFVTAVASCIVRMKMDLNLNTEQEAAWTAFAGAVKQQKAEMVSAMQTRKLHASGTQAQQFTPDCIGEHARLMKQRVAGMESVAAAIKQLYGALTPQQKEILDARIDREIPM